MKIYLDYVFFVNFLYDFILLLGISMVLKRNVSKIRLLLGSLFGALSFFIILFNFSSFTFFIFKMLLAIIMLLITFSYKDFKYTLNNFIYLIILSVLMGGALYLINIEIGYSNVGMIFFTSGHSLNIFLLVLIGLITVIIYSKYLKKVKKDLKKKYQTTLFLNNKEIKLMGYLDTGNDLLYFKKPVLILNKNIKLDLTGKKINYVPFTTLNSTGIMKCIKLEKIFIEEQGFFENIYLALSNDKFHLHSADIILNTNLWEENNETKTIKTNKKTNKKK